jgi:hypothetical protein
MVTLTGSPEVRLYWTWVTGELYEMLSPFLRTLITWEGASNKDNEDALPFKVQGPSLYAARHCLLHEGCACYCGAQVLDTRTYLDIPICEHDIPAWGVVIPLQSHTHARTQGEVRSGVPAHAVEDAHIAVLITGQSDADS